MNVEGRLPTTEQAVKSLRQGMLDDRILYLSDEELRDALAADRSATPKVDEPECSRGRIIVTCVTYAGDRSVG